MKSALLALAVSMAMMPAGQVVQVSARDIEGYSPTLGRKKNKPNYAGRSTSGWRRDKPKQKRAHKDRHKKGRP